MRTQTSERETKHHTPSKNKTKQNQQPTKKPSQTFLPSLLPSFIPSPRPPRGCSTDYANLAVSTCKTIKGVMSRHLLLCIILIYDPPPAKVLATCCPLWGFYCFLRAGTGPGPQTPFRPPPRHSQRWPRGCGVEPH